MTAERKLASVVKIIDIQPIPNADAIVVAKVKGWNVVVKRDEFKVGDLAVVVVVVAAVVIVVVVVEIGRAHV